MIGILKMYRPITSAAPSNIKTNSIPTPMALSMLFVFLMAFSIAAALLPDKGIPFLWLGGISVERLRHPQILKDFKQVINHFLSR